MTIHYVEMVSLDVDALAALYQRIHGLTFGPPAMVAYPPTRQGQRGTFAILIQGGVQHGLWQR